jgi:A/G-specific adenine glycosylase
VASCPRKCSNALPGCASACSAGSSNTGDPFPGESSGGSPYELAVAEILLQRTTAASVARAFPGFISLHPTWEAMAKASLEGLQESLRPLGLWRQKARTLLHLSNVVEKNGGELPCSRRDLKCLPGIGPYTANAVMATVYGLPEPLVDVNMARVLSRFFGPEVCPSNVRDSSLRTLAIHLVTDERCLSVNWAVLDLGALVCRARNPLCQECPCGRNASFLAVPPVDSWKYTRLPCSDWPFVLCLVLCSLFHGPGRLTVLALFARANESGLGSSSYPCA